MGGVVGPSSVGSIIITCESHILQLSMIDVVMVWHWEVREQGQGYVLTRQEVQVAPDMITSMLRTCGQSLLVLFNLGASHSFVIEHHKNTKWKRKRPRNALGGENSFKRKRLLLSSAFREM